MGEPYNFISALPGNFGFLGAAYFDTDGKYLFLCYADSEGEYIVVNESLINDETAFSMGTDGEIEEVEINGHKAVLSDGKNLDWETGNVAVGINGREVISQEELFKIAESMR